MASPYKLRKLKEQHGDHLPDLIVERLNELGSMERVAAELGMSYVSMFNLCKQLGIRKESVYVLPREVSLVAHQPC